MASRGSAGGTRRPIRTDARRRQTEMLRAAVDSLSGDQGASVDVHADIARATGFGRSSVYRLLGDREQVVAAVVADQVKVLRAAVRDVTRGRSSIRDLLDLIFTGQTTMQPLAALVLELPEAQWSRYIDTVVVTVAPVFERARDRGELRADARPDDLRTMLVMLQAAIGRSDDPLEIDRMTQILVDGLCGASGNGRH